MSMTMFRFLIWVEGFIHLAEGLAQIVSLGFWSPAWTTRFSLWMFLND